MIFQTFYFLLWVEFNSLGEKRVGERELYIGERSELNYFPDVMENFKTNMQNLFKKENILRTT